MAYRKKPTTDVSAATSRAMGLQTARAVEMLEEQREEEAKKSYGKVTKDPKTGEEKVNYAPAFPSSRTSTSTGSAGKTPAFVSDPTLPTRGTRQSGLLASAGTVDIAPDMLKTSYTSEGEKITSLEPFSRELLEKDIEGRVQEQEQRERVSSILSTGERIGTVVPSILDTKFTLLDETEKETAAVSLQNTLERLKLDQKESDDLLGSRLDALTKRSSSIPENLRDQQALLREEAELKSKAAIDKARFEKERYEAQAAYEESLITKQNEKRAQQIIERNARLGIVSDSNAVKDYNETVREGQDALRFYRETVRATSYYMAQDIMNEEKNLALNLAKLDQEVENKILEFDLDLDDQVYKLQQDRNISRAEEREDTDAAITTYLEKMTKLERDAATRAQEYVKEARERADKLATINWQGTSDLGYLVNGFGDPVLNDDGQKVILPVDQPGIDRYFTDNNGFVNGVTKDGTIIPVGRLGSYKLSGSRAAAPVSDEVVKDFIQKSAEAVKDRDLDIVDGAKVIGAVAEKVFPGTATRTALDRAEFSRSALAEAYIPQEDPQDPLIKDIANAEVPEFMGAVAAGRDIGRSEYWLSQVDPQPLDRTPGRLRSTPVIEPTTMRKSLADVEAELMK